MTIHVSKLDAAKRQLETAIQFFLRNGDPVSVHTLMGAAYTILEDIGAKQGFTTLRQDAFDLLKEEYREPVKKKINAAKNFFKHADKDPDAIMEFNPESTSLELWDACRMYWLLTQEKVPLIQVLNLYQYANHPDSLILTDAEKKIYNDAIEGLDPANRGAFLLLLPYIEKSHFTTKG